MQHRFAAPNGAQYAAMTWKLVTLVVTGALSVLLGAVELRRGTRTGFVEYRPMSAEEAPADRAAREAFLAPRLATSPDRFDVLFRYILDGFVGFKSELGGKVHYSGLPSRNGYGVSGLEGFARTAPLLAAWVSSGRPQVVPAGAPGGTVDLVALIRSGVLAGTDPASPDYWGTMHDHDQRIVEAADVARTLWLTRAQVWDTFSEPEKTMVEAWLTQVFKVRIVNPNNWVLFPAVVNAFLSSVARPVAGGAGGWPEFRRHYLEAGWFRDGPKGEVDFYNTWAIAYDLFWIHLMDPRSAGDGIPEILEASAELTRHLVSPAGIPILGRSLCYRTAVPSPIIMDAMLANDPGRFAQARRALEVTWEYFVARKVLRDGSLTMGYIGEDPRLVDNYSGPGSCHWGLRSLVLAYMNAPSGAFWTAKGGQLPVETGSYRLDLPKLGWVVEGNAESQEITVSIAANTGHEFRAPDDAPLADKVLEYVNRKPRRPENDYVKYRLPRYSTDSMFAR